MLIITISSLSGGQGKTTSAFFLVRLLEPLGKVLAIDLDPQSNLTFFLGHDVELDDPTALELVTGAVEPLDCVYKANWDNLYLVPSDDGLSKAQDYLANSGMGAAVLRSRLSKLKEHFNYCVIDAPPARSQLAMTALGAAHDVLIPAEALTKGVNSLVRTLELIENLSQLGALQGRVLGVIPFRDRWVGANQTAKSKAAVAAMKQIAEESNTEVFPSILESEKYKQALDLGQTLSELGYPDLELPFKTVIAKLNHV